MKNQINPIDIEHLKAVVDNLDYIAIEINNHCNNRVWAENGGKIMLSCIKRIETVLQNAGLEAATV